MSIRRRVALVFLLAAGAGVAGLLLWLAEDLRPRALEAQEELLVDFAHTLAAQIEVSGLRRKDGQDTPSPILLQAVFARLQVRPVDAQIYRLNKTDIDVRVVVTDRGGQVVFDSDGNRDLGADYSQWRDIARTLVGQYGARATEGDPLYPDGITQYVAAPIRSRGDLVGVVSVGKPARNADRFVQAAILRAAGAALLALLLTAALALLLTRWINQPMRKLQGFASALQRGEAAETPQLGDPTMNDAAAAVAALRSALDGKDYVEGYVHALAHELKSPTAAIVAAAEILQGQPNAADRQRFVGNIAREA